jgi:hypothetical protein
MASGKLPKQNHNCRPNHGHLERIRVDSLYVRDWERQESFRYM